ncbi:hypothetical protein AL854_004332 [Salmonella enterica subsp. enterica]|nr:hypothetical protein [Salmonella enterica subsp. enterica]
MVCLFRHCPALSRKFSRPIPPAKSQNSRSAPRLRQPSTLTSLCCWVCRRTIYSFKIDLNEAANSRRKKTDWFELQRNRDEIAQLRRELAQEQAKNKELVGSVQQFRNSMNVMFELAGNNKS